MQHEKRKYKYRNPEHSVFVTIVPVIGIDVFTGVHLG